MSLVWSAPFKSSLGLIYDCIGIDSTYRSFVVTLCLSLEVSGTVTLTLGQDCIEIFELMICNVLRLKLP